MKLTIEQLDLIDRYLEQKNVDFLDFKLELKDHLACEVEEIMESKAFDFEEAFYIILKGWKKQFEVAKNSWVINNRRTFPNIVFRKIRNRFVFYQLIVMPIAMIGVFFPDFIIKTNNLSDDVIFAYKCCASVFTILFFIGFILLYLRKNKTSFSYMYNQVFYTNVAFLFLVLIIDKIYAFGYYYLIVSIAFLIYNYHKHQQFIKKYNLA